MLEDAFIVKVTDVVVPDVLILPVAVHSVNMYRVPAGPDTGEVTDVSMGFSASNHPVVSVGEP